MADQIASDSVRLAKAYPFSQPKGAYVLTETGWTAFEIPLSEELRARRTPVVASGSNASPERLLAKFPGGPGEPLFVTKARLFGFDSVYSAHISHYGSIPATLQTSPGCMLDVFVTWLTDIQLERMHETEALGVNYDFIRLNGAHIECADGKVIGDVYAYISRRGCLSRNGKPVPLAALSALGRTWQPMTQEEVLDYARSLMAPESVLDQFIAEHIQDAGLRNARTEALASDAVPSLWDRVGA